MARLVWDASGRRIFEAGVDHGVLYVDGSDGVEWNGLLSVTESPSGGEVESFYIDGVKYLAQSSAEEFEATIEAFTYPDEFLACEGVASVSYGLFAAQQRRQRFSLCYRTGVGNDIEGTGYAFKIHLVYDALAEPSERQNAAVGESVEPFTFSWKIITKPPIVSAGIKPTSNFIIDSRDVPPDLLLTILDILYGTVSTAPRMPSVGELLFIFNEYQATGFDAGHLTEEYFAAFDAGRVGDPYTSTIDGGTL